MEEKFNYEDIERFANGEMSAEEHLAFESKMKADPELAKEAQLYRQVAGVMQMDGLVQNIDRELEEEGFFASLNLEEEEEESEPENSQAIVRRLGIRRVLAYAATVGILLVASGFWFANQNYTDGALALVDDRELGLTILIPRGEEPESADDRFASGMTAIQSRNYPEAISLLNAIPDTAQTYTNAQLYLTFARLQEKQYPEAATNARTVIANTRIAAYRMKAEWMLAKALMGQGNQTEELTGLLDKIAADPDHRFKEEAAQARKDLSSFWRKMVFQ